jgi:hypothetical protein
MKTANRTRLAAVLAGFLALPALAADDRVSFTAALANPGSIRPRLDTQPVTVWIERLTTESEAARFDELLREKGERALGNALVEDAVGRLRVGDGETVPIGFAWRTTDDDGGEHLLLVAQRTISFREIWRGSRTRSYPFTVVQLDLDRDGRGSGEIILAGRITATRDGQVEITDADFATARLLNVRRRAD